MVAHCHKAVAAVAKAAAGELYEKMMGDNNFYAAWQRQNPDCSPKELERRFIARNWGKCLEFARKTMALMLSNPNVPEKVKEEIMDALEKDAMLMRGRKAGNQVLLNHPLFRSH